MSLQAVLGILGLVVTLSIFTSQVIFKLGQHAARLEELEKWRGSIREDMHEISDKLESLTNSVKQLGTIIEERTERRTTSRINQ